MQYLTVLSLAIIAIIGIIDAVPVPGNSGKKDDGEELVKIKKAAQTNCGKKTNKCKGQTGEHKAKRNSVKASLVAQLKNQDGTVSDAVAEKQVEEQLSKVHELKKKIHAKLGLPDVEPADDGLFEEDVVLTKEEAQRYIEQLDNPKPIPETPNDVKAKRSASTYFEKEPDKRWRMPVHYWISNEFPDVEKALIRNGTHNITVMAPCISFVEDSAKATKGSQIQFLRDGPNCGGHTFVGHRGIHPIHLGPQTCDKVMWKGKAVHEVIHALGGYHEMSRPDRNRYITINWDNVDPQYAHAFLTKNYTTSYGVRYDIQSRMHYRRNGFAIDSNIDTITPVNDQGLEIGGWYLTNGDLLQLKRMYCRPATCVDNNVNCGTWAAVKEYCNAPTKDGTYMKKNCVRSCGFC